MVAMTIVDGSGTVPAHLQSSFVVDDLQALSVAKWDENLASEQAVDRVSESGTGSCSDPAATGWSEQCTRASDLLVWTRRAGSVPSTGTSGTGCCRNPVGYPRMAARTYTLCPE